MTTTLQQKLGEQQYALLAERLEYVNKGLREKCIITYNGWVELFTGYSYREFFDWDMYFENIYLSYFGVSKYCRNNVEIFLDTQLANGFVTKQLIDVRPHQHFKPFLAQVAVLGCRQSGDYRWLKVSVYNRLKKYLDYWFWYMDMDKNGLSIWESSDHVGMDNQTSRAGGLHTSFCEGVDLNCYLYRELQAMSVLADNLGYTEDKKEYDAHAVRLAQLINDTLWDETEGLYYDRNERTGERIRVKSISCFTPLWAGIAPANRAERMIKEHLTNPEEFWLPYPVATWAKTEPDYYQDRVTNEANWRGPCWAVTNYMIFHGLMRYGYCDLAWELAEKSYNMAMAEPDTREFYNSETGSGMGLNPFHGWSTLLYMMPLEYELGYDPTDLAREDILPIGQQEFGIRF